MRVNSGTIALLSIVCSMAVVFGTSRQALARPVSCCNDDYHCVYGGGAPSYCVSCPPDHPHCGGGIQCGLISDCFPAGGGCIRNVEEACCVALGGTVVPTCYLIESIGDEDVAVPETQEDESLAPGDQLQEELDAPAPFSNAWALAIPAFLFLPVVPVMLRRRHNR